MMGDSQLNPNLAESISLSLETGVVLTSWVTERKGQPWCEYCKRPGHVRGRYWKLHGKLAEKESAEKKKTPKQKMEEIHRGNLSQQRRNQLQLFLSKAPYLVLNKSSSFKKYFLPIWLSIMLPQLTKECFDPIVAKSGRDLIPVMVYGRNISGQEFGGMYCVVLTVNSVVVSAGLLRIFGHEVAELPLVATSREHQGQGYFQVLFSCIETLLSSLNVENLVLPAAEEAESIWTKKFGFRKMTEGQLLRYQRELQLTIFKGTSMLEKKVQQIPEQPE